MCQKKEIRRNKTRKTIKAKEVKTACQEKEITGI